MNGNITKAGITADLEAMQRVGVGGAQIFNVDCGIPHGDVQFMSPEWRELFKHAIKEADRLGIEICVHNCAGWSSSGGPWNTPEHAMQRIVTSEVRLSGPTNFSAALPQPQMNLNFYRDIAVLAFPAPVSEGVRMRDASPKASASGETEAGDKLTDGKSETLIRLPKATRYQPQFAQLEFREPFKARSVKIVGGNGLGEASGVVQVSDDGKEFRSLKPFAFGRRGSLIRMVSLGADAVSAKFWRVTFTNCAATASNIPLAEIELAPRLIVENIDAKSGANGAAVLSSPEDGEAAGDVIQRKDIINLKAKLDANGKLNWQAPAGDWVILRLGHTPTGKNNHPAPKEGEGPECDKLSKEALDAHWAGFMQKILDDVGPLAGKALNNALIDSYEVGGQNWTANFRDEFKRRRGYDLLEFLPTFTARVVESPQITERFLWDLRRTVADLMAENYFGHFAELCRQRGLLTSIEPYTGPFESLQCGAPADIVMGEFWTGGLWNKSVKLAASVAHIYGKRIVGAESFTAEPMRGRWLVDPWSIKPLGDLMYCQGLNRYIFHRYAMQPWTNRWPGMTMGQWGFNFERTSTWWEQGKAWLDYVSRCQFLLQQGRAVADVAYFCGESVPVEIRIGNPAMPTGYDFDAVNADVLRGAKVKDGRITLRSGANYAVLALPPEDANLRPGLLKHISKLVSEGATVVGARPQTSPSLENFPKCDDEVKKLAEELWGKGKISSGKSLADVFAAKKLQPDFEFKRSSPATRLAYAHRATDEADIYFVSNQRTQFDTVECTFRVSGKEPELWHADTGVIERAPVWRVEDGRTIVSLSFDPAGSVFVIFRKAAKGDHVVASAAAFVGDAPAVGPKLEILEAVYEAEDGKGSMDVKELLARKVSEGQLTITASNDELGRDPTPNSLKRLRLKFSVDGKVTETNIAEKASYALPVKVSAGKAPVWQTAVSESGGTQVKAWVNGSAELRTAKGKILRAEAKQVPAPIESNGDWSLKFPPNWGAPAEVKLDKLSSWTEHADEGVKYFSGTASYEKQLEIPADWLRAGREVWLDLGEVKNFAEISLNGKALATLWKPPFRLNVTTAARAGANKLEVKVTNLWPNRLIGDEQLPADVEWDGLKPRTIPQWVRAGKPSPNGRLTFTTWHLWNKDDALLPSGLIGPVKLQCAEIITAK